MQTELLGEICYKTKSGITTGTVQVLVFKIMIKVDQRVWLSSETPKKITGWDKEQTGIEFKK